MRAMVVAIMLVASGCLMVSSTPDPKKPSELVATLAPQFGVATVREAASDGADGPGASIGAVGTAQIRVSPNVSVGAGLDVSISRHDTDMDPRNAGYWSVMLPVAAGRLELGRFGVSAWGGYYIGYRTISEPGGSWSSKTYSHVDMHGGALSIASFVRFQMPNGPIAEIGPFVRVAEMWAKEDESRTSNFDEAGMHIQSASLGVLFQTVFGGGPTSR